ncbi:MAG: hypothetical protein NC218_01615 [Acetobacter sp.]|nr:hypothetical protein [Acetobacter sp.]
MQHNTNLQVMQNGNFNNLNAQPYFFQNCQLLYVRFQPNLEDPKMVPEFEGCTLYDCHTKALPKNAVFYASGKNALYNCTFVEGQVLVVDSDIELYNCHNVKLRFEKAGTYNITARGTSLSFDGITDKNVSSYKVHISADGGRIEFPKCSVYAGWDAQIDGGTVVLGDYMYPAVSLTGCTVITDNMLYARNVTGGSILFVGSNELGEIYGLSCSNAEIRSAQEDGTWLNKKKTIRFGAFVNIGNNIQGIYGQGQLIEMDKSTDAQVVYGNFNGGDVYNG